MFVRPSAARRTDRGARARDRTIRPPGCRSDPFRPDPGAARRPRPAVEPRHPLRPVRPRRHLDDGRGHPGHSGPDRRRALVRGAGRLDRCDRQLPAAEPEPGRRHPGRPRPPGSGRVRDPRAVSGMLIGTHFAASTPLAGHILVVACMGLAVVLGARFVAGLAAGNRNIDAVHAGYLLPTVAVFLILGQSAAGAGWTGLSVAGIGVGVLFWLLLGTIVLARMVFRPALPAALVPTFAIFSAPPAVAGNAWFAFTGGRLDTIQYLLLGTFVLLIAVQAALIGTYWRLPFTLGFWAFTFTVASSGTYALHWLKLAGGPAQPFWGYLSLTLVTVIIGSIAGRSVNLLVRSRSSVSALARA
ncbi:hypothetical protein E3T26_06390 [Cryobacterium sp. TMT1-21]|nr:hypothetical protein E3T26_06390 [Cryobacterium sp. TMT1-21]